MAECSYARCVQQRRNIRRDLQRWTRNMVHIVGLERIAEELMGRRKWKLYQESMSRNYLQPLNNNVKTPNHNNNYNNNSSNHNNNNNKQQPDENHHEKDNTDAYTSSSTPKNDDGDASDTVALQKEKENENCSSAEDRLKDWTPATKCYFCVDGKLDSEHSAHGVLSPRQSDSDSSDSPSDSDAPPSLSHRLRSPAAPTMTTIENVTSMAALAAAFGGSAPATTPPHLPFYAPSLLGPNWYLANVARSFHHESNGQERPTAGEQPLDLSKGGSAAMPNNHRLPALDTKHIFKAKPRMSAVAGRRTYTEDELQAALRDIQSGKLGTRRAAVIYGIPRSTLRNKVYKLALERERESHLNSAPLKLDEEEAMEDDKELSGAEEEKEVEKALQTPLMDILRFSNMDIPPETLKAILHKKDDPNEYIQSLLLAQNLLRPLENAEIVKRLDEARSNGDSLKSTESKMKSDDEESVSNVILKIPSFKPTSNKNGCDLNSPPVLSESHSPPILPGKGMTMKDVKNVIAQSISQKFQQNLEPPRPIMEMDFKRSGYTPPPLNQKCLSGISVIKSQPYQPQPSSQPKPQNVVPTGGKGTRPKRGKYRNYDRDSLVEAVRAVQRGEMSVHRAGSYYGVPHSTLEYKVKERHLMRPRKRDPKPNPVDEKIASLKQNDLRAQDKLKPLMKPPQKFPPAAASPNGINRSIFEGGIPPLPGYNAPPFPFWPHPSFHPLPLDYARPPLPPNPEFFASQLMQKIQEDRQTPPALAKNARQIAESLLDGSGANGSFLDGIIRSSLESGVPCEEKALKEGVENMSNKALLDQLCRNSRLTPLSRTAVATEAGSGDESLNLAASNCKDGQAPSPTNLQTIELSNDSAPDSDVPTAASPPHEEPTPPPRIYLKKDLANPDNLQPEMLMRFVERNGVSDGLTGSASDDAPQD